MKKKKYDRILSGALTGLMIPIMLFGTIYLVRYHQISAKSYLVRLWDLKLLIKLLSLCAFPNLLLFYLFIRTERLLAARGVLLATFIYAFIVMFYSLIQ
ncbi:MAG: hypothetical protein Q8862_09350 [Bacteroidota bacterium]|nr:hypothetical protein [Bacteroidota bacterium]MDP4207044.1 hypothetical protein [Bacteroidota bacterium]